MEAEREREFKLVPHMGLPTAVSSPRPSWAHPNAIVVIYSRFGCGPSFSMQFLPTRGYVDGAQVEQEVKQRVAYLATQPAILVWALFEDRNVLDPTVRGLMLKQDLAGLLFGYVAADLFAVQERPAIQVATLLLQLLELIKSVSLPKDLLKIVVGYCGEDIVFPRSWFNGVLCLIGLDFWHCDKKPEELILSDYVAQMTSQEFAARKQ